MSMRKRALAQALGSVLLMTFAACGGGGEDTSAKNPTTTGAAAPTTVSSADELPAFSSDFDRVCTTQVGFGGATAYEPVAGNHPVILFEESVSGQRDDTPGRFVSSSRTFPAGWTVKEDMNFEDNSELKAVQLVACADRVKETPTGKQCEFDDDGKKFKLELVDTTYELKVYAATTGKELKAATLEGKGTECPYIAVYKKGDTKHYNEPSDDQYTNALKPVVAP